MNEIRRVKEILEDGKWEHLDKSFQRGKSALQALVDTSRFGRHHLQRNFSHSSDFVALWTKYFLSEHYGHHFLDHLSMNATRYLLHSTLVRPRIERPTQGPEIFHANRIWRRHLDPTSYICTNGLQRPQ